MVDKKQKAGTSSHLSKGKQKERPIKIELKQVTLLANKKQKKTSLEIRARIKKIQKFNHLYHRREDVRYNGIENMPLTKTKKQKIIQKYHKKGIFRKKKNSKFLNCVAFFVSFYSKRDDYVTRVRRVTESERA